MTDTGALDALDLDDMFNDDGDMLFEGLDIELDGMGDIINNEKKGQQQHHHHHTTVSPGMVGTASGPPLRSALPLPIGRTNNNNNNVSGNTSNRRTGGPRTKRTNPMMERVTESEGSNNDGNTTLRKTKRKTRAPVVYSDNEDEKAVVEEQPQKKTRKAAIRAKKATEIAIAATQIKSSKRTKKGDDTGPVVSNSAGASGPAVSVTASSTGTSSSPKGKGPKPNIPAGTSMAGPGQFGGRLKIGPGSTGPGGTIKGKRKVKKSSSGADGGDGPDSATTSSVPPVPAIKPPKPEPTYGGLLPSKTLFYPFLESVPPEPSLQKRKAYPVMDRISSALTAHMISTSSSTSTDSKETTGGGGGNSRVTEDSAIFKLMAETFDGNDKDKSVFTQEKRAALVKGIPHLREMIGTSEKGRLVGDVFSMCWLLTRQYNFLKQSLANMNAWCKNDFTPEDYQATYTPPTKDKQKQHKWKSPVVRIKIVCSGYKDPKGSPALYGVLPPSVVDGPAASAVAAIKPFVSMPGIPLPFVTSDGRASSFAKSTSDASKAASGASSSTAAAAAAGASKGPPASKAKKKKEKVPEKDKGGKTATPAPIVVSTPPVVAVPAPPLPKTYAECSPQARRQKIMDKVAQLALDLERAQAGEAARAAATAGKLSVIPDEDPPLHTARMWEWLQSAGYYKQPTSRRLALKSPEIHPRGLFLPVPTKIQGHEETDEHVSSDSLFDRLQSLLVVEDVDDDDATKDDDASSTSDDDEDDPLGFLDEDDIEENNSDIVHETENDRMPNIANLAALSVEERAFIHLSSVGLIRKSLFPKVELAVTHVGEKDNENGGEDDLVNVIGEMASDLSRITSTNNARISYLETASADSALYHNKQIEEDQAALIAKCQSLMKRNKEKAKAKRAKHNKKDDNLNLPW